MINRKLRNQILSMYADDQDVCKSDNYDSIRHNSIAVRNTRIMKKIIDKHGWPTYRLVGYTTAKWAWLLVQHADHDVEFQKKCLQLMKKAVKEVQASKEDFAYLTDRVLVHEGKKQLYGTQFYIDDKKRYKPRPIKDRLNLDKRRKKMELQPFREYERYMKKMHRSNAELKK